MTRKSIAIVSAGVVAALGAVGWLWHRSAGSSSTSQTINATIDNLVAAAIRMLELPTFVLLAAAATFGAVLAIAVARLGTGSRRLTVVRVGLPSLAAMVVLGLAISVDRRIRVMQTEVNSLRDQLRTQRLDMIDTARTAAAPEKPDTISTANGESAVMSARSTPSDATKPVKAVAKRDVPMFDVDKVPRTLTSYFGANTFRPHIYDQATDLIEVKVVNPPLSFYMAIVDLRTPGLEVKLAGTTSAKTFTTDFARNNDCTIAINGEAGNSPQLNSGFGPWIGNFITKGQVLIKEQPGNKRPFLAFDPQNNATFTPMAAANRSVGANPYNVIWGRLDAVVNNVVQTENERDRQPRTAMGIDKDGTHLYMLVVDGRQQQYSIGFTRAEVGATLQAFGAWNGMLCDEGGSSCLYAKKLGGILNSPSDGAERATYTHFGISLKTN